MNSAKRFDMFRMFFSVLIALLISFVIIFFVSEEPVTAIATLITGPFKSKRNMGNVIESMVPLIFTGTGVCIMFSANQINLATEGGFHLGGLVAAAVALKLGLPAGLSPVAAICLAALAGAAFCTIPAIMKIKTGSPELPTRGKGTNIHVGLLLALLVAVLGYVFLFKTRTGYELRLTGENESFARYSGINIVKVVLISQMVGGMIAGMGGGVELLSPIYSRFSWTALLGYGWDAIIICTLARKNPLYTPLAALFLAYLRTGASIMARYTDVTLEIVQITQGIIILLVVAEQFLSGMRHRMIAREAKASLKEGEVA